MSRSIYGREEERPTVTFDSLLGQIETLLARGIPAEFRKTWDKLTNANVEHYIYIQSDPELNGKLQEFLNWVRKLQGNIPKAETWLKKFREIEDVLAQSLVRISHRKTLETIQRPLRRADALVATPEVLTLDSGSVALLERHFQAMYEYLEAHPSVSLYLFGEFLRIQDLPTVYAYKKGIKGSIIGDTKHPFWVAFARKVQEGGGRIQLKKMQDGQFYIDFEGGRRNRQLFGSLATSPTRIEPYADRGILIGEGNSHPFESDFTPPILSHERAKSIIESAGLIESAILLVGQGMNHIRFWDFLNGLDQADKNLISPPQNRGVFQRAFSEELQKAFIVGFELIEGATLVHGEDGSRRLRY